MRSISTFIRNSTELRVFSSGLIWSTLGTVAMRLTPIITTILIARWFGIDFVGTFAVSYGTLVSASLLAAAGVSLMATRNVAAHAQNAPETAGRLAGMALLLAAGCGTLLGLTIYLFAGPLADHVLKQPHLTFYLEVISPIIVLSAIHNVQTGILAGLQEFKIIARVNMIFGALMIVAVPTGLYFHELTGSFVALGLAYLVACLISHAPMMRALRARGIRLAFRGSLSEWPMITRFAVPALMASILFEPVKWICTTIVVNNPDGLEQVGIFFIAMQLETLLLFVPQIVVQVIIPMLSTGFGEHNRARVMHTLGLGIGTNLAIAAGFVAVMFVFGDWFLILFKLDPALHWPIFLIVVMTSAMIAGALPLGQVPVSSGYMWTGLAITAGWATTFILWTWLLQDQGALGMVIARAIAWTLQTMIYIAFTRFAIVRTCPRESAVGLAQERSASQAT